MRVRLFGCVAVVAVFASVLGANTAVAQTGAYGDVPDDVYYSMPVAELAALGVFAGTGCGEGFCPGEPIDRKTMAVWMVRVLDGVDPAAVPETRFDDVDAAGFHARFIERMAELGVTTGCGDGSGFCPDRNVTRAQMAAFLSRAYDLPDGPDPGFSDVPPDAWYAADVAKLDASGITRGCGDGTRFCPSNDTTHGQTATFLWRGENPDWQAPIDGSGQRSGTSVQLSAAMDGGGVVSAGDSHVCWIGADQTITCRGYNGNGQASPPSGTFTAVAAGGIHSCGIRTDQTITCWGYNADGQASPPSRTFTAVAAGGIHSCGIRTDQTITCWGYNADGQASPPSGTFTAVAAGTYHSCGIRTDQTITCWGHNADGQASPPSGIFTAVAAGSRHSCGIRIDQTITCWGYNADGQTSPPSGTFTAVAAGASSSCGIGIDETITCWGPSSFGESAPRGTFQAFSLGGTPCGRRTDQAVICWEWRDGGPRRVVVDGPDGAGAEPPTTTVGPNGLNVAMDGGGVITSGSSSCGRRPDLTLLCWGEHGWGELAFPEGQFLGVSTGLGVGCGVLADQTITCWGQRYQGGRWSRGAAPPGGRFTAISVATLAESWGDTTSCAVRADQTLLCWDAGFRYRSDAPSGQFLTASVGLSHSCGLRTDQTIACWGSNAHGEADAPTGQFQAVSAGAYHSCGLSTNQAVTCWGHTWYGQSSPPSGQFQAVSAGTYHSCGLRTDETITCWGPSAGLGYYGQTDAPAGRFLAVSAGHGTSCAMRVDQTVTCWGARLDGGLFAPLEPDPATAPWVSTPISAGCQRETPSGVQPGRPAGARVVQTGALDPAGRLTGPATVEWTTPCRGGAVDHYRVEWRRGYESFSNGRQHIIEATTSEEYSFDIPDLQVYAVRVAAVGADGQSQSTELGVSTPPNRLRAAVESVVTRFQNSYPWLAEAWAHMNSPKYGYLGNDIECIGKNHGGGCVGKVWLALKYTRPDIILHEMAHVQTLFNDLADNPAALGAGHLYVADLIAETRPVSRRCQPHEAYASLATMIMPEEVQYTGYLLDCDLAVTQENLAQELVNVVRSVFVDQEVPQWFYDTYQGANGSWDLEAIRSAVQGVSASYQGLVAAQLRHLIPEL